MMMLKVMIFQDLIAVESIDDSQMSEDMTSCHVISEGNILIQLIKTQISSLLRNE